MSPSKVRVTIVMQKSTLVDDMLGGLVTLPLTSLEAFSRDVRDAAAAESIRRFPAGRVRCPSGLIRPAS